MEKKIKIQFLTTSDLLTRRQKLNDLNIRMKLEGWKLTDALITCTQWSGAIDYSPNLMQCAKEAFLTYYKSDRIPAGFATKTGIPDYARFIAKFRFMNGVKKRYPSFDVTYKYVNKIQTTVHSEERGFAYLLKLIEEKRVERFIACRVFGNDTNNLSTKPYLDGGGDFGFYLFCDYNSLYKPPTGPHKGPPLMPVFTNGMWDIEATKRKLLDRQQALL
jgi:hypothetical protein